MSEIKQLTPVNPTKDGYKTIRVKFSQYEILSALAEYCDISMQRAVELMLDVASEVVLSKYAAMLDTERLKEWAKDDTIAEDIERERRKRVKDGKKKS